MRPVFTRNQNIIKIADAKLFFTLSLEKIAEISPIIATPTLLSRATLRVEDKITAVGTKAVATLVEIDQKKTNSTKIIARRRSLLTTFSIHQERS